VALAFSFAIAVALIGIFAGTRLPAQLTASRPPGEAADATE
jgi:hypothetical protein